MKSTLPALCADLRMRDDAGVPVVNSRDVAEFFGKQHPHVLRDVANQLKMLTNPNLDWFRLALYEDAKGERRPSYDLTRQGFTLLVMGWTGAKATEFKVRYIEAFDAMERALQRTSAMSGPEFLAAVREMGEQNLAQVRELVAPLAIRFDGQDRALERVEIRVDGLAEDVAYIKQSMRYAGRRKISDTTKREQVASVWELGGRCPCCGVAEIVVDGCKSQFAEFDHAYSNSLADPHHTWLICKPCHQELTTGRVSRASRESEFKSYQDKRRRLPGRQMSLFG